jgi:regulator of sigma E protease
MAIVDFVWNYAVPFLLVLTVLVFVHEMGHYLVARYNDVRVEVFSVGFGGEAYGWTSSSGTRWRISWIPLGGYVRFFGDANAASAPADGLEDLTPHERAVSFHHKRLGQRAAVIVAGPAANFLLAIVLFAGLFVFVGQAFTPPVVGSVLENSAAAAAGFVANDRVVSMDGTVIERFQDMQRIVSMSPERPIRTVVERSGETLTLMATPRLVEETDRFGNAYRIGRIGITGEGLEYIRHDPFTALWRATGETVSISAATLDYVGQMIMGRRSTEELGGPVRIAQMSGQMWQLGMVALISFAALLSINLGLINLFPIPMLDGGHLLFYAIEALRGRPVSDRIMDYGFRLGLALVLCLAVFVTWNDLAYLKVFDYIARLLS